MTTKTNFPKSLPSFVDIPDYLHEYITEQDPSLYTPEDHAVWRFIRLISPSFLKNHGHPLYLTGLKDAGVSAEKIPLIRDVDAALKKIGWRAIAVNGLIPPNILYEFLSLRILPIACDIRNIQNLNYTLSPDIILGTAGYAPILSDPHYRHFLESFGKIAKNAIIHKQDLALFDVIWELTTIQENPNATVSEIALVQKKFDDMVAGMRKPSEAALLSRLNWWTREYGMIQYHGQPVIYGAKLLTSVLAAHQCIQPEIKKAPLSFESAIQTPYDMTRAQLRLLVSEDFESLTHSLEAFANTMCFRRGGDYALQVAKEAETTVTVVLDSGIQLSGVVADFEESNIHEIHSLTLIGNKQFSYHEEAMAEFGYSQFGSKIYFPMFDPSISTVSLQDLTKKLHGGGLTTKSGCRITGHFRKEIRFGTGGRLLILENVQIENQEGKVVFEEKTKLYPFILCSKVTSVFGGVADQKEFFYRHSVLRQKIKTQKTNATKENEKINALYLKIKKLRESTKKNLPALETLAEVVKKSFSNEWLAYLELLELYKKYQHRDDQTIELQNQLIKLSQENHQHKEFIQMGLELFK